MDIHTALGISDPEELAVPYTNDIEIDGIPISVLLTRHKGCNMIFVSQLNNTDSALGSLYQCTMESAALLVAGGSFNPSIECILRGATSDEDMENLLARQIYQAFVFDLLEDQNETDAQQFNFFVSLSISKLGQKIKGSPEGAEQSGKLKEGMPEIIAAILKGVHGVLEKYKEMKGVPVVEQMKEYMPVKWEGDD